MTVDHNLLPSAVSPIRPQPEAPWAPAQAPRDPRSSEAANAVQRSTYDPAASFTGWPRIYPGL